MEPLLTEEELAALRETQGLGFSQAREVRTVDLISRDHRVFGLLPELQATAERYARTIESLLARMLAVPCHVVPQPVEIIPAARLRELWVSPRFVYAMALCDQEGAGAIGVDSALGSLFVSRQFGGEPRPFAAETEHPPTATERRTVGRLARILAGVLVDSLAPVARVEAQIDERSEHAPAGGALLLLGFSVKVGDHQGRAHVVMDTASGCFQEKRMVRRVAAPKREGELAAAISQVRVDVRGVLGRRVMTMREIFALQVGDVLSLDNAVDSDLELQVQGRTKFVGRPMLTRGILSISIAEHFKE